MSSTAGKRELQLSILSILIVGSSSLLIYDAGKSFKTFVQNEYLAYTYALLMVVSIIFLMVVRGLPRRTHFFSCVLIVVLEGCMLWASAIGFTAPLFRHELTDKNKELVASYKTQAADNNKSIRGLENIANSFGKKNPINLSRTQKDIAKLQKNNAKLQVEIAEILHSKGKNEVGFAKQKQAQAVIFRVCSGLIQLVLLSILGVMAPIDIRLKEPAYNSANDQNATPGNGDIVPHGTLQIETLSDKDFVNTHIQAGCTGKKGGIYTVTDINGTVLGQGRNSRPAWASARRNIERRIA